MDHKPFLRNFEIFQEFIREILDRIENSIPDAIIGDNFEDIDKLIEMIQNATDIIRVHAINHVHKCHVDNELNQEGMKNMRHELRCDFCEKLICYTDNPVKILCTDCSLIMEKEYTTRTQKEADDFFDKVKVNIKKLKT